MRNEVQDKHYSLGEDYFVFEGIYRLVEDLCYRLMKQKKTNYVIDAGCGAGNFLIKMKNFGLTFGCDSSYYALKYAQRKSLSKLLCADLTSLPIKTQGFHFVITINTLEHIEDDMKALDELFRITKAGGYLIAIVPAFMSLWGNHDIYCEHYRRYRLPQFRKLVESTGFEVEKISYFEPEFYIPVYIYRKIKKLIVGNKPKDDFFKAPRIVNYMLTELIEIEKYWLRHFNFPFGFYILCIARKPA
jgi:ubiquinone/menaquinone biosynthesis C-methylase UbiE